MPKCQLANDSKYICRYKTLTSNLVRYLYLVCITYTNTSLVSLQSFIDWIIDKLEEEIIFFANIREVWFCFINHAHVAFATNMRGR